MDGRGFDAVEGSISLIVSRCGSRLRVRGVQGLGSGHDQRPVTVVVVVAVAAGGVQADVPQGANDLGQAVLVILIVVVVLVIMIRVIVIPGHGGHDHVQLPLMIEYLADVTIHKLNAPVN